MPFSGFSSWEECIDKVAATADDPEAVCGKLKAEGETKSLTYERVAELCPSCAAVMKARGILAIRGDAVAKLLSKAMSHEEMQAQCQESDDPEACMKRLMAEHGMHEAKRAPVLKVDEAQRMVFGWANVAMLNEDEPVVDLQDDTIDAATLEKAAYDYVRRYRVVNDMHHGPAVGDLVESFVLTPEKLKAMGLKRDGAPAVGMWVGFKLDDDEWAAFKRGERPMFSIEGEAQHA